MMRRTNKWSSFSLGGVGRLGSPYLSKNSTSGSSLLSLPVKGVGPLPAATAMLCFAFVAVAVRFRSVDFLSSFTMVMNGWMRWKGKHKDTVPVSDWYCLMVFPFFLTTMISPSSARTISSLAGHSIVRCFVNRQLQPLSWSAAVTSRHSSRQTNTLRDNNNNTGDNRIPQIRMHPSGLGQRVLSGGFVMDKRGKKQYLEMALGYFWMIKDLSVTGNKPILSNETLIPEREAEPFPTLYDLTNLNNEKTVLPDHIIDSNGRSIGCTISSALEGAHTFFVVGQTNAVWWQWHSNNSVIGKLHHGSSRLRGHLRIVLTFMLIR